MLVNLSDVVDSVLANAITATVSMLIRPRTSKRTDAELAIAGWLDVGKLTEDGLPTDVLELPALSSDHLFVLSQALQSDETQGALQALLAARLTDAPETDAARAREAVRLAITATHPVAAEHAERLSDYYDDRISALVGHLEGSVGLSALSQVRSEAYSARVIDLLGAIEQHIALLTDPSRTSRDEKQFLARYRSQARYRHGHIEPPDFERRRRVPLSDIYVPTLVSKHDPPNQFAPRHQESASRITVRNLPELIHRTVLLGDPGGGKTTAANFITNEFASDATGRVPFLVTLRDFAVKAPPERSVLAHIEHTLDTLYQSPPPMGLIERLLFTGRAIVIFDGLDELLDTSRRRDVTEIVEQFGFAYPLSKVFVTSRLIGYNQSRLDDTKFTCYRLDSFADDEVKDYARKWFALQEYSSPDEAEAFLAESSGAKDLRSNPLLLSLMCILYRGAGSLPSDRAEIYEQCATLLFRKWDERRRIHQELRVGHLVEPAIRHLAYWLFIRDIPQTAVVERQLVAETVRFLLERRLFESKDEANDAAREFVAFCRGRLWVFSEAGTTADGEMLYAFTHRTFLEYFTATNMAATSDTPEELARAIQLRLPSGGWDLVNELAIQIKDRNSDRGVDRIYTTLLKMTSSKETLSFLARHAESTRPSPATIRNLTNGALDCGLAVPSDWGPLRTLITNGPSYSTVVADQLGKRITKLTRSGKDHFRKVGLQLALECRWADGTKGTFWSQWSDTQAAIYATQIASEAAHDSKIFAIAVHHGALSPERARGSFNDLGALSKPQRGLLFHSTPRAIQAEA